MEIRDVIAALREKDLEQQRMIDALRLDVHVLWNRMMAEPSYAVSRETKEDPGGPPAQDTLF